MSRLLEQPLNGTTYARAGVSIEAGDAAVERISRRSSRARSDPKCWAVSVGSEVSSPLTRRSTRRPCWSPLPTAWARSWTSLDKSGATTPSGSIWSRCWSTTWPAWEPNHCFCWTTSRSANSSRRSLEVLVAGIAEGCRRANTALLGGETAEHAGVMAPDDLDVAGFAVGVVERGDELDPEGRSRRRGRLGGVRVAGASLERVLAWLGASW